MKTLVDVLSHHAEMQPHSLAYIMLGEHGAEVERLTYRELDRRAKRVAGYLQSLGLEDERVLLVYPPGLEFIAAFMGCLYAGVVAVPAHPPGRARSAERLQTLISDCDPALGLTTTGLHSRIQREYQTKTGRLRLIDIEEVNTDLEWEWQPRLHTADQLALLQYTSGSTSVPKGVMVTHQNLLYMQQVIQGTFRQTSDSVIVNWLPFYHDMGLIGGILQPMFIGARCILMAPMQFLQQPVSWLRAIADYGATTSGGPDFAYGYCVQKISPEQRKGLDLSCWQVAFSGSEPVRASTLDNFCREFSACGFQPKAFQPCYGLAEATLLVSGGKQNSSPTIRTICPNGLQRDGAVFPQDSRKVTRAVSSGSVSAAEIVVIVDPVSLEPCRDQNIGEIWMSGPGVASGYWKKPLESEAVFGARLKGHENRTFLRTGDMGFLDDGELFISGRLKDIIIIRGVNHYPQDIEETVYESDPNLRSAGSAAFSIQDDSEAERLIIVQEVEQRSGTDFAASISRIRTALAVHHELQAHAIVLVRSGTIPKTSSGKIQRHACRSAFINGELSILAEWRQSGESPASDSSGECHPLDSVAAMQNWLVKEIAALVGSGPGSIEPHFTLFDCGGDSLTAIEIVHRIETLNITLPIARLLDNASIAEIASELLAGPHLQSSESSAVVVSAGQHHPLSYGQKALWFLQQMTQNSAYNLSVAVVVKGDLNREALKISFQKLAKRHSNLRSTFRQINGHPVQFCHENLALRFTIHPAAAWTADALRIRMAQEMNEAFDIEAGPLWRVALYEREDRCPALQLTAHHLIADFWSLAIALNEISQLYAAATGAVAEVELPPAPAYSDFVKYESALLEGPQGERLWNYWRSRMSGTLPVCSLSTYRPRDINRTYCSKTERMHLDRHLVAELRTLARRQGCTFYVVLLAAFKALLFRYTDNEDILIGSPAAGRISPWSSRLIGYCVNPLPLRTQIVPTRSFLELIETVRQVVTGAFDGQQYPFPLLVEKLEPVRTSARTALFQMMFTFLGSLPGQFGEVVSLALGEAGAKGKLHDLEVESLSIDQQFLDFDLNFLVGDASGAEMGVALQYGTELFDSPTMIRMMEHWRAILRTMVKAPGQRLSDCSLMTTEEVDQLALSGNGPCLGYPERCIHRLIEEIVQKDPRRVAIIFEEKVITYGDLNCRANQLANHFLLLGASADTRIGICLDRSPEMVVALVAILKAGAAYVPLDPTYPKERLSYMVKDASIHLVVTTRDHKNFFIDAPATIVWIDAEAFAISRWPTLNLSENTTPDNLAYVIYTSGSTGDPKGVMITHRSVVNFFTAMESAIGDEPGVWLALTSISFDISVLELLWTLAHGFQVVISQDGMAASKRNTKFSNITNKRRKLDFSLFYFAATDTSRESDKYELLLESARFADQNGFQAVWTPERHFHTFGGLYPNPSVTGAALATITSRVRIRAGSIVLPLHHPARVAEEWAVVDNLSRGRVDVSFASGWHADDFVLAPEHYAERKMHMVRDIETVQKLWRGEAMRARNGNGQETSIRIYPKPCQPELPCWITAAGSADTFELAGQLRAGLLTHLLGQSVEELAKKIAIYRDAWRRTGAAGEGHVTLMLHTFLGEDEDEVRATVRGPFCDYLRNSVSLISGFARNLNINLETCSEADMKALLDHAFDRYFATSGLFGTLRTGLEMAHKIHDIGVDEVACLIDFGIDNASVMKGLEHVKTLQEEMKRTQEGGQPKITHIQCTPSMAKMLMADPQSACTLTSASKLLIGGEAVSSALLEMLSVGTKKQIFNVYGPTETTIWSAVERIDMPVRDVSLGKALANTRIQILDRFSNPVPFGRPGEICIAGDGLARGYLGRPDLTATRFIPDALSGIHGARLYRTGDQGRWREDGNLQFLGRLDFQVKVRGCRIECGEIEVCLEACPGVKDAAVRAVRDAGDNASLVAYIVPEHTRVPSTLELREFLANTLPDYMIPSYFVALPALPMTPNGKIDRNRLPEPEQGRATGDGEFVAPRDVLEQTLADLWSELLNLESISIHANFFSIGGHSLLATELVSRMRESFQVDLPLQTFFSNPTVAALSAAMLHDYGEHLYRRAEILDAVTRLSDEEVELALKSQTAQSPT